jgi:hypothetical protein
MMEGHQQGHHKALWKAGSLRSAFGTQCLATMKSSPACGFGSSLREAGLKVHAGYLAHTCLVSNTLQHFYCLCCRPTSPQMQTERFAGHKEATTRRARHLIESRCGAYGFSLLSCRATAQQSPEKLPCCSLQ